MDKLEYVVLRDVSQEELDEYGEKGWRVVSAHWRDDPGTFYGSMDRVLMERKKENPNG